MHVRELLFSSWTAGVEPEWLAEYTTEFPLNEECLRAVEDLVAGRPVAPAPEADPWSWEEGELGALVGRVGECQLYENAGLVSVCFINWLAGVRTWCRFAFRVG